MNDVSISKPVGIQAAVIMLNWNSAEDTIESIESALSIKPAEKVIVVVDNDSADSSANEIFAHFCGKCVSIISVFPQATVSILAEAIPDIVLIRNDKNAGFAGGNNVGIRFILEHFDTKYIWLLNNDSVVDAHALETMIATAELNSKYGFVGSVIRYYDRSDTIQCFGGGLLFPCIGKSKLYLKNQHISRLADFMAKTPDFIMGASLLVRTELIRDVGIMSEDYFMYFEESDWQLRAKRAGWHLAVAPNSYIFHKDSGSTANASHYYFYYLNRAAILFSERNFSRLYGATAAISLLLLAAVKGIRNPSSFKPTVAGVIDGIRGIVGEKKW